MKIKFKKILPFAIGGCLLAAAIALGSTVSYLADYEDATNVITIGDINLEVSEGSYEDSKVVAAGQTLPKAPTIKNTGETNDEYVFFSVAIPKRSVTLLYEQTSTENETQHKEGTKYGEASLDEIFKTIADGIQDGASATEVSYTVYGSTGGSPLNAPQVFVQYNKGIYNATAADAKEGWIYLGSERGKTIESKSYDVYWFGYNRKLLKKTSSTTDTTIPLFDRIQLKSFIDEELVSKEVNGTVTTKNDKEVNVIVKAYGIQADNLGITGLPEGNGIMTDDKVKEIYDIVNRKQGTT